MLIRVIGALLVIWLAFLVLGVVSRAGVLAVIGAIAFVGTAATRVKNRSSQKRPALGNSVTRGLEPPQHPLMSAEDTSLW